MPKYCFSINCGSSSIRFALSMLGAHEELIAQGAVAFSGAGRGADVRKCGDYGHQCTIAEAENRT